MAAEAASETLKQQFLLLQEQQQQKLLRRKQRKEEKSRSALSSRTTSSVTFGVDDNLDLKLADPVPNSSGFVSEELVEHLNNQIRELKDENGRVYKLLSEKDFEIRQIKKKSEDQTRDAGGVTNETAATKIVELSKKIRELNSELESERTKARQYGKKCMDLQSQLSKIPEDTRSTLTSAVSLTSRTLGEDKPEDFVDVKGLQDKLKYAENKMAEYRNQTSMLKQELKMVHKVLSQEVGENVNIQSILNNQSNWKGRAQQVMMLQKKVDELKAQLGSTKQAQNKEYDLEAEMLGNSSARQRTAIDKHREQLRKIEKERKDAQEKAASEFKALEEDHAALKKKFEAAKTRNSVLANQIKTFKEQMKTFTDKGQHDDELIDALMKQQSHLQQLLEQATSQNKENNQKSQQEIKQMSMKTQQDSNVVEQLKAIVAEKETKVHRLEEEIQQLKLNHLQKAQIESANMLFQQNVPRPQSSTEQANYQNVPRPPSSAVQPNYPEVRPDTAGSGDVQIEFSVNSVTPSASRMSDRPPIINSALDRCPSANSTIDTARTVSVQRRANAQTPTYHVNNLDKQALTEMQSQVQEYKTLMQVAQVERDKLSELVKVLQDRAEEASTKLIDSQNELVQQRRKNALLEKQIGKSKIEQTGTKERTVGKKKGRASSMSIVSVSASFSAGLMNEEEDFENLEEIKTNLEIQRDENEALKAALQSTLKAKEEDFRLFNEMMDETKRVFIQALRQYKQNAQGT